MRNLLYWKIERLCFWELTFVTAKDAAKADTSHHALNRNDGSIFEYKIVLIVPLITNEVIPGVYIRSMQRFHIRSPVIETLQVVS